MKCHWSFVITSFRCKDKCSSTQAGTVTALEDCATKRKRAEREGTPMQTGRPEKPHATQTLFPLGAERPLFSSCVYVQNGSPFASMHGGSRKPPQPAKRATSKGRRGSRHIVRKPAQPENEGALGRRRGSRLPASALAYLFDCAAARTPRHGTTRGPGRSAYNEGI